LGEKIFKKLFERLITWLHVLGSVLILVLMAIIVVDVLGRFLLGRPLTGAPELVKAGVVSILFLGLPKTFHSGRQVRATILLNLVSPRVRTALNLVADVAGLVLFGLLVYSSWDLLVESWRVGEFEGAGALRVPTYPVRTLIIVSAVLTGVQLCLSAWRSAASLAARKG
jgi:TRAP-type C4-dicarboxylate transport system permease small subunit